MVQIKKGVRSPPRKSSDNKLSGLWNLLKCVIGFFLFYYLFFSQSIFISVDYEYTHTESRINDDLRKVNYGNWADKTGNKNKTEKQESPMDPKQVSESRKMSVSLQQKPDPLKPKVQAPPTVLLEGKKLVHVIHTRFMQHQPKLVSLGKARLKLFETFCLPTIVNQRNQEFLWIIRTDPELHEDLKSGMLELLKDIPNVVLVGSNEVRKGSVDGGFRSVEAISDIVEESLWFGEMAMVTGYYDAAKELTLLETNLDADDGLATTFVGKAQSVSMELLARNDAKQRKKERRMYSGWLTLCVGRHAEWQFYAPYDPKTENGSFTTGSIHVCITPGLTHVSQPKSVPRFTEAHHWIKKETPECRDEYENTNDVSSPTYLNPKLHEDMGCWLQLPTDEPHKDLMAIRARTPTSTGMSRITTADSAFTQQDIETDRRLFSKVTTGSTFRITREMIRGAHSFLKDNMSSIVAENLEGQCQKDHSCSEGIKKKLKSILFKDGDFKNKHGVVHVVQTEIENPRTVDVWRHFCMESMEVQTTYEFLWIIRIKNYDSNPKMSEAVHRIQMVKILEKSSLNILIVKSDGTPSMEFRQILSIADITNNSLLYGSFHTLQNFYQAAQNSTLLETTLGPTEAFSKTFVEDMQKSVALQKEYGQEDAKFAWYYRCESKFLEWNYFHPRGTDEANVGYSRLNDKSSDRCGNNPATTRVSMAGAEIPFFADISQAEMCQKMVVLRLENGCYLPMSNEEPIVARTLIPDSIGKPPPSELSESELAELEEADKHLSTVLRYSFNILPYSINIIHEHIEDSQCGDGSVCNAKLDSDYGVVQIVQTWIPGPDFFDIWRDFCFSIELQTNKKFLWIIRIPFEADKAFIHKVAKPLNKTPLNVIIVKSSQAPAASFREDQSLADITSHNIVRGDMETLQYFHRGAKEKPLLETTLRATDALAKTFIDDAQKMVSNQVKEDQLKGWYYQCTSDFVEWNYHDPRGGETDTGFLNEVRAEIINCLDNPGVTRVSLPTVETLPAPSLQKCNSKKGLVDGCFAFVFGALKQGKQSVARVSVPKVIHGVIKKEVEEETFNQLEHTNKRLKGHLKNDFGIFPVSMKSMRKKMEEAAVHHHGLRGTGQKVLANSETWSNSHGIVHVVHTRLLQHQPTMLVLGKVRLDVFKTLCLATISQQTNKEFLWIIRTDPELDPALKENLFQSLEGVSNVVVVASGDGSDGIYNGEFRERHAMREFSDNSIMYGNLTLVQSYHEAAKTHTLLETNIDSDDGLTLTFVDNLQTMTLESFQFDSFKIGWINLCLGRHLEWHFYAPWQKKSEKGCLLLGSIRNCVKSGLSWAVNVNAKPRFMTDTHLIKDNVEQCSNENRTATNRLIQECWDEVPLADAENDVTAIRSMTPASNGLARGEVSKFDYNIAALKYDGVAWELLEAYFGVNIENIKESRAMIVDNLHDVVLENDRSACTHDKTCVGHWQNKFRLVHVVYVSVFDPNIVDVFRRVALSALVGQTSSEFLLIVRIEDFTDQRLTDIILKEVETSAIEERILVFKSNRTTTATFRSENAISDLTDESLLHGNMAVLKDYRGAAQTRPLLETHVKPYEGFKRDFVEELYNATVTQKLNARVQSDEAGWYYQCVPTFVKRTYFSPRGAEEKNGYYSVVGEKDSKCVKRPGTTRVSFPGAQIPSDTKLSYAQECSSNEDGSDLGGGCYEVMVSSSSLLAFQVSIDLVAKRVEMEDDKIQELDKKQFGILREVRADFSVFPPTLKNMRKHVQENEREIIHIIHSSLHDPALIYPWRLMLMDSLQLQTSKNFLYILRSTNFTDPKVLYNLMYPLSGNHEKSHINAVVVDSDYVPAADFRTPEAIADITNATLLLGDMDQLVEIHKAAGARTVVETFLSPTEGLASSFVADLQGNVLNQLKQNQMQGIQLVRSYDYGKRTNWYYDCISEFVEWSYHSPWGKDVELGFLKLITSEHESNCVGRPGTTRITLPGSTVPSDAFEGSSGVLCPSDTLKDGCYIPNKVHDETKVAMAIMPKTIENAVASSLSDSEIKKLENQDKLLSKVLADSFNISPYSREIMRKKIHDQECESGEKVCTAEWDSQYGVVHVFQTSLQDPNMFEAWRKFSFGLEAQTTRRFLWILRVLPDDAKLMKDVLKPINKTPLNIIVVESSESPTVDFRHPDAISDINKETIRHGKIEMLQHYRERAKDRPLLETFLDVTDGLSLTFANDLQESSQEIIKENKVVDAPNAWYYQCVPTFITWSYFNPRGDEIKGGSLRTISDGPGKCIDRPGTSRISLPKANISTASKGLTACAGKPMDGCFSPMKTKKVLAARVIIPESFNPKPEAGLKEEDLENMEKDQERLGKLLKSNFNIPPISRTQFQKKMKEMLEKKVAK